MIIDLDTANGSPLGRRCAQTNSQFAAVLAQYAATPLFAPWPAASQIVRANPATSSAELNTHPAASNRREGRHARG